MVLRLLESAQDMQDPARELVLGLIRKTLLTDRTLAARILSHPDRGLGLTPLSDCTESVVGSNSDEEFSKDVSQTRKGR